ncbi:MAG: PspA/IM30 family protein [Cyanothece sp. SIO1E1]|nr:PspA/IM30 family protein [Cyanothece sp. SIO1E1]
MGLLDRITRVIRSNISSLVSRAEDPEKILEQTVIDMQDDLIQLRQGVAQAIATQKRTERQYSQAQSTADEWQRRAQLALQKGDENLAREALTRRKAYLDTAGVMKAQLEQQSSVVAKLKQNMMTLENQLSEAKTRKDMFIARARSAQASKQINEMMDRFGNNTALSAFERMEDKVNQLEAQSEAIAELNSDNLEGRFAALEGGSDIDSELAAMKAQMLPSSEPANLPPAETTRDSGSDIDSDLEKLRSQLEDLR